jgi:hypothetical protein
MILNLTLLLLASANALLNSHSSSPSAFLVKRAPIPGKRKSELGSTKRLKKNPVITSKPTVFIVGAGPVGMAIAARYLDERKTKNELLRHRFIFIEKRSDYTRQQQLAINWDNWKRFPLEVRTELAKKGCIRASPLVLARTICYPIEEDEGDDFDAFPEQDFLREARVDTVFNFVLKVCLSLTNHKDFEDIVRNYISGGSTSSISFFSNETGSVEIDRYEEFLGRTVAPVHFVNGEFSGLKNERVKVMVGKDVAIELIVNPLTDVIIGCDGSSRYIRLHLIIIIARLES